MGRERGEREIVRAMGKKGREGKSQDSERDAKRPGERMRERAIFTPRHFP